MTCVDGFYIFLCTSALFVRFLLQGISSVGKAFRFHSFVIMCYIKAERSRPVSWCHFGSDLPPKTYYQITKF